MPALQIEYESELVAKGVADALHTEIKDLLCYMCGTVLTPDYAKLSARDLAYKLIADGHRPWFTQKLTPAEAMAKFMDPSTRLPALAQQMATNPTAAGSYVEQVANRLSHETAVKDVGSLNTTTGGAE